MKMIGDIPVIRHNRFEAPSGKEYLVFDGQEFEVDKKDIEFFEKKGFKTIGAAKKEAKKESKKKAKKKAGDK